MTEQTAPIEAEAAPAEAVTPETAAPAPVDSVMAATSVPVTPEAPAAPVRPEGLPDAYWDDATGIKPEAYARLVELETADAARREGVPEAPDGYALTLAEEIKGPDGKPVEFAADDPLAKAILPALHEAGIPQAGVSKLLTAYAKAEIEAQAAEVAEVQGRLKAEIAKLGPNDEAVKQRTGAVQAELAAKIGPERAEALRRVMTNADAFMAVEALIQQLRGPGISAVPHHPATPAGLAERLYGNQGVA